MGDLIRVPTEVKKPFPPMSNAMNPKEEKRFFQAHVIEFHNGGTLTWD
ncbi:ribonucleoside-triphosphate reductase [Hoeflea sp. Naph1]